MTQTIRKLKISEVSSDEHLSYEGANCTYPVERVREMIRNDGDLALHDWQICTPTTWSPNADHMIKCYIEQEREEMYEDWDVEVEGKITKEDVAQLQSVLDRMFGTNQYWKFGGPEVIIDSLD